jgi:hypothetical protein
MPYRMCNICKKSLGCIGARRQNLSCLRVEKLGCVGSRQLSPASLYTPKRSQVQSRRCLAASWGQTGHPKAALPSIACRLLRLYLLGSLQPAVSSLYLPKTAFVTLANLQSEDLTLYPPGTTAVGIVRLQARRRNRTHPPPGQSPAYTDLKQHFQPLQIFNQKI